MDKLLGKIETRTENAKTIMNGLGDNAMLEQAPIMRNSRPNYYALLTLLNDSYDF